MGWGANSLVLLPCSLSKVYLIMPELLTRFYIKLQEREVVFLSSAIKQSKGFKSRKKISRRGRAKDMNCSAVEAARSSICVKIKVAGVLEQGTSYLIFD